MAKVQTSQTGSGKKPHSQGSAKKSSSTALIVTVVVVLLFVAVGVLVFMLNIGNLRESLLRVVSPQADSEETVSEEDLREAQIRDEIIRLDAREDELDVREDQLDVRENDLKIKEEEVTRIMQENIAIQDTLSPQHESISSISEMFGNMESEQAAFILSAMESDEQIILIIKNLDKEKSAEILGLMQPERSSSLFERMILQE